MIRSTLHLLRAQVMQILRPSKIYLKALGVDPISNVFGFDRGHPVDRYYIENFIRQCSDLIKGDVLEVQNDWYIKKFGGAKVTHQEVLDILPENKLATIVGDLRDLKGVKDDTFDCLIVTQTFHLIDNYEAALRECRRILKPGGVLLATQPCISRIDPDSGPNIDSWRITPAGVSYLFGKVFDTTKIIIEGKGNAVVGAAIWLGLSQDELSTAQLDKYDPMFPCMVTIKAFK